MLYAPIAKEQWPLGLEEVEYLQKQLSTYATPNSSIQVVLERSMFGGGVVRFTIIEWGNRNTALATPDRNVLGEYTDVKEVTGMLRLLLGMAKDKFAARQEEIKAFTKAMYQHRKI
jgi:hypothetical protein